MSEVRSNFNELKEGICQGKFLDMFDKYFHNDVDMYEGGELKANRKGKANNREYQENFIKNAKINEIKILRSIIDGDVVAYEMLMDFEIGGQAIKKNQWVIQTWNNGQVIREEYL
ncbi:hypothetical protein DICPUDRAFT_93101 [Dictyostelium purpureum]|uniref:SnoaL-like domain-containing protein n=1 Tax=Dictyostelium purpureum TaxID=5786 RepID=F1A205_DICPU|nr:uncharacterized protein DICPUDRAFT_93101 [Dictyostelium purpureum]EGC29774.1 hypothetical protein DICPUDRAFT_93101 [Dictyostelium purpureum]|eukprot:XP_003293702.1 hypothetical protein DICPUDRAFT_93101 [Dictyostelium purpureum]